MCPATPHVQTWAVCFWLHSVFPSSPPVIPHVLLSSSRSTLATFWPECFVKGEHNKHEVRWKYRLPGLVRNCRHTFSFVFFQFNPFKQKAKMCANKYQTVCFKQRRMRNLNLLLLPAVGEPKNDGNCAFKHPKKEGWWSDSCGEAHAFTCYDKRLLVVTRRKTWEGALQHCRSLEPVNPRRVASAFHNYRYDLVTLLSEDDNAFALWVARKVTNSSVRQFFFYNLAVHQCSSVVICLHVCLMPPAVGGHALPGQSVDVGGRRGRSAAGELRELPCSEALRQPRKWWNHPEWRVHGQKELPLLQEGPLNTCLGRSNSLYFLLLRFIPVYSLPLLLCHNFCPTSKRPLPIVFVKSGNFE